MQHPGVYCKKCNKSIDGYRYKCIECDDFDFCKSCQSDYHSGHVIIRFSHQITPSDNSFLKQIADRRPRYKPFLIQGFHEQKCNSCNVEYVNGFLYKCCDCIYNACHQCEKTPNKCLTGEVHLLFRFADPLSLNNCNKRFWFEIVQIRRAMRGQSACAGLQQQLSSGSATREELQPIIKSEPNEHEEVKCNICTNDVIGRRYICIDCGDFNLCSTCEPETSHLGHILVRVGTQLEFQRKHIFDQIVQMRLTTNGGRAQHENGGTWNMKRKCDVCVNVIHGYHYKCLECDFNMCSFCQTKEWHMKHLTVRFNQPLTQNPMNRKFYEAVERYSISPRILRNHARHGYTSKKGPKRTISPTMLPPFYVPTTDSDMSTDNELLYEAIMEFNNSTNSHISENQPLHGEIMEPNMSSSRTFDRTIRRPNKSTDSQIATLQTQYQGIAEPMMSISSFQFNKSTDSHMSESLPLCKEVTEPDMSSSTPLPVKRTFDRTIRRPNKSTDSQISTLQTQYQGITEPMMSISSAMQPKQPRLEAMTEPDMSTDQILNEGIMQCNKSSDSQMSENHQLLWNEGTTEPKTLVSSVILPKQPPYEPMTEFEMSGGFPTSLNLYETMMNFEMSTSNPFSANPTLNGEISSSSLPDSPELSLNQPIAKFYNCEVSPNQTLCKTTTKTESSSISWMSAFYEDISDTSMTPSHEASLTERSSSDVSPNQTLYETCSISSTDFAKSIESLMEESSGTMTRTNVMDKKQDDNNQKNGGIAKGEAKTIPNCTMCDEMPSEIMLLSCGHVCICLNCIDGYIKKDSRQCPICKCPIRSTHRVLY